MRTSAGLCAASYAARPSDGCTTLSFSLLYSLLSPLSDLPSWFSINWFSSSWRKDKKKIYFLSTIFSADVVTWSRSSSAALIKIPMAQLGIRLKGREDDERDTRVRKIYLMGNSAKTAMNPIRVSTWSRYPSTLRGRFVTPVSIATEIEPKMRRTAKQRPTFAIRQRSILKDFCIVFLFSRTVGKKG